MPFLIRAIIQGAFVFITALLSFVGITPDISVPTEEESRAAIEERKEIILSLISDERGPHPQATEPVIIIDDTKLPVTPQPRQTFVPSLPHVETQTKPEPQQHFAIEEKKPEQKPEPAPEPVQEKTLPSTINNVVVNIVCTQREGNRISVSTGSGVIISENGVVLTNAHVAQSFLLKNYTREGYMDCTIRRENIPTVGYTADLLYISKDWMANNSHLIHNAAPTGTGENDYALLVITGSTNPALALPSKFPAASLELQDGNVKKGDAITAAGYPGNQVNFFDPTSAARLETDTTSVYDTYTFDSITTDIFSTGETPVAMRGSSGGGLFSNNKLVGIVATTSGGSAYNVINAITLSYITRDIKDETGSSLSTYISGNVKQKAADFTAGTAQDLLNNMMRFL